MAKANTQMLVNYGAKGLGAVAVVQLANNLVPQIMANQFLAYAVYGISVGAVLATGVGIWAVDQLVLK